MQPTNPIPVALLCSDIHLCSRPPVARMGEADWFAAMARPLKEIGDLAARCAIPVFCSGDIFDHWKASPELVNFALEHLPEMYAIPGQHDLPYHSLDEIRKSSFWTLVMAGKVIPAHRCEVPVCRADIDMIDLRGFAFGEEVVPPAARVKKSLCVALTHQYVWIRGKSYQRAPNSSNLAACAKSFKGYDVVVIGDNHKGFLTRTKDGTVVFNCGTLMRRTVDEETYQPHVGLLYQDGTVKRHVLDTSKDVMGSTDRRTDTEQQDFTELISELCDLGEDVPDFRVAVNQALSSTDARPGVRRAVQEALDGDEKC